MESKEEVLEAAGTAFDSVIKQWRETITEHARSHLSGCDCAVLRNALLEAVSAGFMKD